MPDESRPATILLVEDEALIALLETRQLEDEGYRVIHARTGEEAISLAGSVLPAIDLVLMDIDLGPGMDGTQAAQAILGRLEVPVVFLSSHTEREVVERTEKITSYGYVTKNSGATVLTASIRMAFRLFTAHCSIRDQKRELERKTEELETSEAFLGSILDQNPDPMWISDASGTLIRANGALLRMFGISLVDVLGKYRIFEDNILEEAGLMPQVRAVFEQGEMTRFKLKYTGSRLRMVEVKNDTPFVIDLIIYPIRDPAGRITNAVVQYIDISDQERIGRSLHDSRETLDRILNTVPQAIFWKDREGRYLGCNRAFAKTAGLVDPSLVVGLTDFDLPWPREEAEAYQADDRLVIEGNRTIMHIIEPIQGADGRRMWIDTSKTPLCDAGGLPYGILGVYEDFTERRAVEERLMERQAANARLLERLNEAQRTALIGSWEWDLGTGEVWWSDETFRIYGKSRESYRPSFVENSRFIHPEDLEDYGLLFRRSLDTGEALNHDFRLVLEDGSQKHCNAQGRVEADPGGRPLRFLGTIQDISARKAAEEEIRNQLAEKDLILKEAHHRVKNNLASVEALLRLQSQSSTNPEAVSALNDAVGRIEGIRLIYQRLLQTEDFQSLPLRTYLEDLVASVVGLAPGNGGVEVETRITDFPMAVRRLFPLGSIVNELLTNALKYAFSGGDSNHILLEVSLDGPRATLVVQDNGRGLPPGFDPQESPGFGLNLVRLLCGQLGSSFVMESQGGTRCTLEFAI